MGTAETPIVVDYSGSREIPRPTRKYDTLSGKVAYYSYGGVDGVREIKERNTLAWIEKIKW